MRHLVELHAEIKTLNSNHLVQTSSSVRTPSALLFFLGLAFVITPWASQPLALALGLAFGLIFTPVFYVVVRKLTTRRKIEVAPAIVAPAE